MYEDILIYLLIVWYILWVDRGILLLILMGLIFSKLKNIYNVIIIIL